MIKVLPEPLLEFASNQLNESPHDGLSLFGPYSSAASSHPSSSSHIVIGTKESLSLWQQWSNAMNLAHCVKEGQYSIQLWSPYPGYSAVFGTEWNAIPVKQFMVDSIALEKAAKHKDPYIRTGQCVDLYINEFLKIKKLDANVSFAICLVPEYIYKDCRSLSTVNDPVGEKISSAALKAIQHGQKDMFSAGEDCRYLLSPDFRRQLKARAMQYQLPIQILRESTLNLSPEKANFGERGLTPISDRMWNLATALYYKSGGKPWKLSGMRKGVCYVGLTFKQTPTNDKTACCAAQMFLDSGDGLVFVGDDDAYYSNKDKQYHLSSDTAYKLLKGVLDTYETTRSSDNEPLHEIFLHCKSYVNKEEYQGYLKACPPNCRLTVVRISMHHSHPRLFRDGSRPVLRGTYWRASDKTAYLFGTGFKPRLGAYDGFEVPIPMRIDILRGDANIDIVAEDIFGLTKLNYNGCKFGSSLPVTIKFSNTVGEIIVSNPGENHFMSPFKYYI